MERLTGLRVGGLNRDSSRILNDLLAELPERLGTLVAGVDGQGIANLSKDYADISGLTELSVSAADASSIIHGSSSVDAEFFRSILQTKNYASRLREMIAFSDIIGSGFDDVSEGDKGDWLSATAATFPLSAFFSYSNLAGELSVDLELPSDTARAAYRLLPALLFALARGQLGKVRTEKEDQDKERMARLEEGLRTTSPSLRDLAFSKTRKDLNLTGIKNLYSKTYGEIYATSIVTVPSNAAPSMTYGVEKRAQLLFVLEYCARNVGNLRRVLEEYELLSGTGPVSSKPIIPNPSIFLAILRREMSRVKDIEKALTETEAKTHNQAFIYYTEAGRPLSRLPLKTRPRMVRLLKDLRGRIRKSHADFRVEAIPGSLRDELVQFLTVAK